MSLILNNDSNTSWSIYDASPGEDVRDAALLDRYLAIMETNKKSSRFVPNDALLALDMAEFARGQLARDCRRPQISIARLAMSLVQPQNQMPIQ